MSEGWASGCGKFSWEPIWIVSRSLCCTWWSWMVQCSCSCLYLLLSCLGWTEGDIEIIELKYCSALQESSPPSSCWVWVKKGHLLYSSTSFSSIPCLEIDWSSGPWFSQISQKFLFNIIYANHMWSLQYYIHSHITVFSALQGAPNYKALCQWLVYFQTSSHK